MFWLIITILLNLLPAEGERSRFSADKYTRNAKEDKTVLDGNVTIVNDTSVLRADSVELNNKTNEFTATGKVEYKASGLDIKSEELKGSMTSAKGMIKNGRILSGKDIFEGAKINRVSRNHFLIQEGSYTSCTNDPPDWRLYGNDIDMTSGEYAHLKDVVIELFGLPITYIPYFVLPIKNERQSGFLPPSFGFGSDGFNINEPYFWAISRSQDATFTLGHYGSRGLKEAAEYRSVFAQESFANMYVFHVDDKKFAATIYNGQPLNKNNRYGARMDQDLKFSDDISAKFRIRYVTDANIPRDFSEEMEGRADPSLESKFLLLAHTQNVAYTSNITYYEDMLNKNPLSSNSTQPQRLPELSLNLAKTKYSIFMFEADASYLNVYRSAPFFDDMNNDNVFDPTTDFIRTGQRFDFFPRVSVPITTTVFKLTPAAGVRYDFYKLPVDGNAHRTLVDFTVNLLSEISKSYQRDSYREFRALKHSIEPFVDYHVIPTIKQSPHPFFDIPNAPMFDSVDQIGKTNTITYGITNRLMAKQMKNYIEPVVPAKAEDGEECKTCASKQAEKKEKKKDDSIVAESTDKFLGLREADTKSKKKAKQKETPSEEDFTIVQPLQWRLYQSYNFLDTTGQPFGNVFSDITASHAWMSLLLSNFYNIYTKRTGISSQLRLTGGQRYVQVGYYNDKTKPGATTDQLQLQFGFGLWRFFTNVRFILNNSLPGKFSDRIQDKYFDLIYNPPSSCWYLKFAVSAPYDKPGFNMYITFSLLISGQAIGFGSEGNLLSAMNFGSK
ncbi:MAG: LPS assembly protein LptD [bacterium]